jgi:hypothetical protein
VTLAEVAAMTGSDKQCMATIKERWIRACGLHRFLFPISKDDFCFVLESTILFFISELLENEATLFSVT